MNADLDTIIGKIKKCMALSKSDNANEAASALRQAQALMRKHGVDEAAMANAEVSDAEVETKSANASRPPVWEAQLAVLVGNAFGCRPLVLRMPSQRFERRAKAGYRFVGLTANALTAAYTMTVLLRQLRECRAQHLHVLRAEAKSEGWKLTAGEERSAGDAFCLGWLKVVSGLVANFANSVDVENAIARRVVEATKGCVASTTRVRIGAFDQGSIHAGEKAAEDVSLHRPVNQPGGSPALGFQAPY